MNQDDKLDKPEQEVFGLTELKCDGQFLYKVNSDGTKVFEIPLTDIQDLKVKVGVDYYGIVQALACAAPSVLSYFYIETEWLKWTVVGLAGISSFVFLLGSNKTHVFITTIKEKFKFPIDDNKGDLERFLGAVKILCHS